MRVLVGVSLVVLLAAAAVGDDKQPPEKKASTDFTLADLAGTWKNDTVFVKGRLFQNVVITIQPDGKAKSTYKEKDGTGFTLSATELRIKQAKVKVGEKETTVTTIDSYLGVQWILQSVSPTKIKALAVHPTDSGPKVEEVSFTKEPEKKEPEKK